MSIFIDNEFQSLIPPLSEDEFKQLEENCVRDGIRDPLVVWDQGDGNDTLIDGHNRFRISVNHSGIRFDIKRMYFKDRDEAKIWIIHNQLGRRNLHELDQAALLAEEEKIIAKQAQMRMMAGVKTNPKEIFPEGKQTRDIMGAKIGVSGRQYDKLKAINEKATERTKQLVRSGDLSINQAYNSVHPKQPDPIKKAKEEHKAFEQNKAEGILNFQEAQKDKSNKVILENAMFQDFLKLLNNINGFKVTYRQDDLVKLAEMVADDEIDIYMKQLDDCRNLLLKIESLLIRR